MKQTFIPNPVKSLWDVAKKNKKKQKKKKTYMYTDYYQTFGIYSGKYLLIEELLSDSVKIQTDTYITSYFH